MPNRQSHPGAPSFFFFNLFQTYYVFRDKEGCYFDLLVFRIKVGGGIYKLPAFHKVFLKEVISKLLNMIGPCLLKSILHLNKNV